MVTTAEAGVPREAPLDGLLSVNVNVSFPSTSESLRIGMRTVREVSPALKVRTPAVAV